MKKNPPDFILFTTVIFLVVIGVIMVFSSSSYYAMLTFDNPFHFFLAQLLYAFLGVGVMIGAMSIPYTFWQKKANLLMIVGVILLILVLTPFLGDSRLGAQRWIKIGSFSFQPSEFVKIISIIFIASLITVKKKKIDKLVQGIFPILLVTSFIAGLILLEDDLGTTVILSGTVFIMLLAAGAKISHLLSVGTIGFVLGSLAIAFEPYRRARLFAFLDPENDPSGAGWQILNSLMSIGSGGLFGLGLGQGRHSKFLYLPERQTDFIFAVIGEELGFIGCAFVIMLFVFFMWRGYKIALSVPNFFGSLLATGIVSSIGFQAFINIGVVTSSLPVTGLTLPFLSYGGTSLVATLASVGILLNISRYVKDK